MQVEIPLMKSMENIILVCIYNSVSICFTYIEWLSLHEYANILTFISKIVMKSYGYV